MFNAHIVISIFPTFIPTIINDIDGKFLKYVFAALKGFLHTIVL